MDPQYHFHGVLQTRHVQVTHNSHDCKYLYTFPVDCGAPPNPMGGSVHYTGTGNGSKALIECSEGLKLQGDGVNHVVVCTANGNWLPDPFTHRCIEAVDTGWHPFL